MKRFVTTSNDWDCSRISHPALAVAPLPNCMSNAQLITMADLGGGAAKMPPMSTQLSDKGNLCAMNGWWLMLSRSILLHDSNRVSAATGLTYHRNNQVYSFCLLPVSLRFWLRFIFHFFFVFSPFFLIFFVVDSSDNTLHIIWYSAHRLTFISKRNQTICQGFYWKARPHHHCRRRCHCRRRLLYVDFYLIIIALL